MVQSRIWGAGVWVTRRDRHRCKRWDLRLSDKRIHSLVSLVQAQQCSLHEEIVQPAQYAAIVFTYTSSCAMTQKYGPKNKSSLLEKAHRSYVVAHHSFI